jgi:hypothetical protein
LQIIIESIDNKSEQFLVRFKGSMMCKILVFHILLLCLGNMEAHGDVDEYQMTRELTDYVLRNYSRNLPPRRHQGDLVNITVDLLSILSIMICNMFKQSMNIANNIYINWIKEY